MQCPNCRLTATQIVRLFGVTGDEPCPLCLEEKDGVVALVPCGHTFCASCADDLAAHTTGRAEPARPVTPAEDLPFLAPEVPREIAVDVHFWWLGRCVVWTTLVRRFCDEVVLVDGDTMMPAQLGNWAVSPPTPVGQWLQEFRYSLRWEVAC
ncbi:unnamed protein product [Symbiodinium natans]|uniref:RING-type domain-containing protein n=1 Tax=Symbiodinium natans TaxID=878477 RepID=A0A812NFJ3_9DINO|nr:unnamed protein product [Symbiodinium natans]